MQDRHKIFISFRYEDILYKDFLVDLNKNFNNSIFEDYSVGDDEISDTLESEQIRKKIRDEFIKDSTVLVLLNGKNMRQSKFIDWELHAAMFDTEKNPKMGILVINLPENTDGQISCLPNKLVKNLNIRNGHIKSWVSLESNLETLKSERPNSPIRLLEQFVRPDVSINVIDWNILVSNQSEIHVGNSLNLLIHEAFITRQDNNYDISTPLRRRENNSLQRFW